MGSVGGVSQQSFLGGDKTATDKVNSMSDAQEENFQDGDI